MGFTRSTRSLFTCLLLLTSLQTEARSSESLEPKTNHRLEQGGLSIEMRLASLAGESLREGDDVSFEFDIRDASGRPMSGAFPAAWMDLVPASEKRDDKSCQTKLSSFISGSLLSQPELDLNIYYVLTLNDDPSISVVDPLFGFGGSKLLDMVLLESPGVDWALTSDQQRLFVSMPEAQGVAVIDTATWTVLTKLRLKALPGRLALQEDGAYLWIAFEDQKDASKSGVAAYHLSNLMPAARIVTGEGPHDLAFSQGDRYLWVTNQSSGTVSLIEVAGLGKVSEIATAPAPVSVEYSALADMAYVSHDSGSIVALSAGSEAKVVARMVAEPGLRALRFAPGGRYGFVPNPAADVVHILDAAKNRIVQTGDMETRPNEVTFSDELAYVRHAGSEIVLTIPLDQIGREGEAVPVVDFPGGQEPPGQFEQPALAAGIVQAPGANAVLVANPGDEVVYYYKEGMAAPMGSFSNYGRRPRAVRVVDRSLREHSPGIYRTEARLRRPGHYDVAFFMDSPRVTHCFEVVVEPNLELAEARRRARPLLVEPVRSEAEALAGQPWTLQFELRDPHTQEPVEGLEDVQIMALKAPGTWHRRHWAEDRGKGRYAVRIVPPESGVYYAFVGCESRGLGLQEGGYVVVHVSDPAPVPSEASTQNTISR